MTDDTRDACQRHWRHNRRLIGGLMFLWLLVSFVMPYFARDLDMVLFGWPFSVWMASQGALLVYLGITWYYARRLHRLDLEHGVAEPD